MQLRWGEASLMLNVQLVQGGVKILLNLGNLTKSPQIGVLLIICLRQTVWVEMRARSPT